MKPKIRLVAVASEFESGGQRADDLLSGAKAALEAQNVSVVLADKVVWNPADALDVCKQFKKDEQLDAISIIVVTWVADSLLYLFTNKLQLPVVYWTVPYTETFSIGCIHHYGAILKAQGLEYEYVYGLPDNKETVARVKLVAEAGRVIKAVRRMNLALVGPRQTWRVAGPQDMTNEEWEFSKKLGVTIIHIEMDEIIKRADAISDEDAQKTLDILSGRTGKVLAGKEAMIYMAKMYMATKKVSKIYSIDAMAAECYPMFSGMMNLTASWMADDGFIVDTEGDIGNTAMMYILNQAAKGGATALGEVGSIDDKNNILSLAHEGSTAHSLAADISKVQISPSVEKGTFVGLPLKPMETVTVSSIVGNRGNYKVLVAGGNVVEATHEEWVEGGSKLLVKLHINKKASDVVNFLMQEGMDHHLLVKEGNYQDILSMICKFVGLNEVNIY